MLKKLSSHFTHTINYRIYGVLIVCMIAVYSNVVHAQLLQDANALYGTTNDPSSTQTTGSSNNSGAADTSFDESYLHNGQPGGMNVSGSIQPGNGVTGSMGGGGTGVTSSMGGSGNGVTGSMGGGGTQSLAGTNLQTLITDAIKIVNQLIVLIGGLAVVVFLWGIIKTVLNPNSEDARAQGRSYMIYGVVAFAVIIGLWGLVQTLLGFFGVPIVGIPQIQKF